VAIVRLARDERGLIGKLVVLWLVVLALVVVAAIDAGSIVLARMRTSDVARDAASASAQVHSGTGDRRQARLVALATVADADEDARVEEFAVTRRGRVSVTVSDRAGTLLVGRFGLLEDLATVTVTESSDG
jgi:hypothetical protein